MTTKKSKRKIAQENLEITKRNFEHPIASKRNFAKEKYKKSEKILVDDRKRIIDKLLSEN